MFNEGMSLSAVMIRDYLFGGEVLCSLPEIRRDFELHYIAALGARVPNIADSLGRAVVEPGEETMVPWRG